MNKRFHTEAAAFDQYASEYDAALAKGVSVSGEDKQHFARECTAWWRAARGARACARDDDGPAADVAFFLLCSPRWLFLIPGAALIALGLVGYGLVFGGERILAADLTHTLLFASLTIRCGAFSPVGHSSADCSSPVWPCSPALRFWEWRVNHCRLAQFGSLDDSWMMRLVIPVPRSSLWLTLRSRVSL